MRRGFACLKVKVGLPDDLERVAAVREAIGPWPALRVDANGAWPAGEAVERIAELEGFDLQLVEQPCATLEEMAEVRLTRGRADRRRRVDPDGRRRRAGPPSWAPATR